jgi:biopolymer transport protein ExbD
MAELVVPEKGRKRSSLHKIPVRIDLTAMVDLAFLLITFFILTTTLQKQKAMTVDMPVNTHPEPVGMSSTMTVCLGKNNKALYYLGMPDRPLTAPVLVDYSKNGLRKAIVETGQKVQKTTGKHLMVILKPSGHSVYANLVAALDELNITGVPSYAIVDISSKDIDMLKQKNAY